MTDIHRAGSREKAANRTESGADTLQSRILSGLGKLASGGVFGRLSGVQAEESNRDIAQTLSFLDADEPEKSPIAAILDELDAQFDAASDFSPELRVLGDRVIVLEQGEPVGQFVLLKEPSDISLN